MLTKRNFSFGLRKGTLEFVPANVNGEPAMLVSAPLAVMLKTYPKVLDIFAWAGCIGNVVKNFGICFSVLSVLYEAYVWLRVRKLKKQ